MFRGLVDRIANLIRTTGRNRINVTEAPAPERGVGARNVVCEGETVVRLQTATRPMMHDCVVYLKPDAVGELQEALNDAATEEKRAIAEKETDIGGVRLQQYPPHGNESRCIVCDERIVSRLESIQEYNDTAFAIQQNQYIQGCPSEERPQPVETHVGVHYSCADDLRALVDACVEDEADTLLGDAL